MIKITSTPTYTAPIVVEMPGDNGKFDKVAFTAVFRRLTIGEIETIHKRLNASVDPKAPTEDASADPVIIPMTDDELVRDVMVGWGKDVIGDDGLPLEFNDAHLTALLDIFPVRPTIVRRFFDTIANARAKN